MDKHQRLSSALAGQPVDRTPVWFMRQAGRYLPEYMEVRSRVSFLDLCGDADLACEVTVQPITRFDFSHRPPSAPLRRLPRVPRR